MRLFYFDKAPNFGDLLNPWLWPQLLGERLQPESDTLFLGLGTILKTDLPSASGYVVLGAGGGYGPLPPPDARWRIYAVRGPRTAEALGLPPEQAAIDSAYLLRDVPLPAPDPAGPRIGFMPHFMTALRGSWSEIAAAAGLRYLDPTWPVDRTLAALRGCDAVIGEAMHACIVADALRVPWLPVRVGGLFLDFKWRDWLDSVEVAAVPQPLRGTTPWIPTASGPEGVLRRTLRRGGNGLGYALQRRALVRDLCALRRRLERDPATGHLSNTAVMERQLVRLRTALEAVRRHER